MIKTLHINKYKKLADIDLDFDSGVNAISGANGTCKSSLLHVVSNAFQSVSSDDGRLANNDALSVLRTLNNQVNVKIEKLTKGDREYNDPAPGSKGNLFEVEYLDSQRLAFRRHNSTVANRYAVKPAYAAGKSEKLPSAPVVYLGLARLLTWGEYQDEASVKKPRKRLPQRYLDDLADLYCEITGIDAQAFAPQKMGNVKNRQEFGSGIDGVDSNTISSGEDNVLIMLTALMSLRYYYDSLTSDAQTQDVVSLLLVDEFDATLHPSFQHKLLSVVEDYSARYCIQVIFTTHSLYLLNQMFARKMNVIYLMDYVENVKPMPDPDPAKIEMYLTEQTRTQMLVDKIIPVFTEDEEARLFADILITELATRANGFLRLQSTLHFVDANFGAEELQKLFKDVKVRQSSMAAICMLDGDRGSNITHNLLSLPGSASPEWVAFEYAIKLCDGASNDFWEDPSILAEGFNKAKFTRDGVRKIEELRSAKKREKVKRYFNSHVHFFRAVLKAWVLDPRNINHVRKFARELEVLYRKTASYHGLHIAASEDFDVIGQKA